jgi:hypothetical protein
MVHCSAGKENLTSVQDGSSMVLAISPAHKQQNSSKFVDRMPGVEKVSEPGNQFPEMFLS